MYSRPRCKAKFDYDSTNPDDLTFKEGDVIQLVEDVGSQWLKGQLRGKTGIFPESFVEVIEPLPAAGKNSPSVMNGNSGTNSIGYLPLCGTYTMGDVIQG